MRKATLILALFLAALPLTFSAPANENASFNYAIDSTWTDPNVVYVSINTSGVPEGSFYRIYNVSTTSLCDADTLLIYNDTTTDPNKANYANASCIDDICNFGGSDIAGGANLTRHKKYKLVARNISGTNWVSRHDNAPGFPKSGVYVNWTNGGVGVPGSGWIEEGQARCIASLWGEILSNIPEATPPEINASTYNMTSEGGAGCTNWRTNRSNPCPTSDTTPTVTFATNEPARCAIGISDSNYTSLGSSRNCTDGQLTQSHICTLDYQDELFYETSYFYIGCQDVFGNENRTSTSGALRINVTSLETIAKNSIELGIGNSLSTGYTLFTDQKVYARNSANNQTVGTFDKVVKKLNKIWTFNWLGPSESRINLFNITPVLYSLEFANKTNLTITQQVELLINATK